MISTELSNRVPVHPAARGWLLGCVLAAAVGCGDDRGRGVEPPGTDGGPEDDHDGSIELVDGGEDSDADAVGPPERDAGSETPTDAGSRGIEIRGVWQSNFGGEETIEETRWSSYGVSMLVSYDNRGNWAILLSPADDAYHPNTYSKLVWTEIEGGRFYYCILDYGLASAQAARSTSKTADATAPNARGCGDFPWTELSFAHAL
jgi:hypothetical protein